jgi:hypothetical protein
MTLLSAHPPPKRLKVRIMEPEETAVAGKLLSKHVPAVMNTHTIEELLDVMFSMWSISYQILSV